MPKAKYIRKPVNLETVLLDLIAAADAAAPNQARIPLDGDLVVNLRRDGSIYRLLLWRKGVYPAMREWNTICAHWPYNVGAPNPHKGIYQGKFYLQGTIPAHPKISAVDTSLAG